MNIINYVKKILFLLCLPICFMTSTKVHADASTLLIAGVQTESLSSASDEYISIVNTSPGVIALDGMYLEYFSASAADFSSPYRSIELTGSIEPKKVLFAASTVAANKNTANWLYSATLAAAGGHIRLVQRSVDPDVVMDVFAWGTATMPEGQAAELHAKGVPYSRKVSAEQYQDTNNNKNDFSLAVTEQTVAPTTPQVQGAVTLPDLHITELFPDPASPLTDANDEYIELYNASSQPISLAGMVLQTGSSYSYSYTFEQEQLPPRSYKVFYASQTNLSLSNSGGKARLLNASGDVVDETASYEKAPTGESWTLISGVWQWTESSPLIEGSPAAPEIESTAAAGTTKTTSKKTPAKKTTKAATTTAKAKKETDSGAAAKTAYTAPTEDNKKVPVNPLILAGVGVFALGYMIYEYKSDIYLRFKQFRRNRPARN